MKPRVLFVGRTRYRLPLDAAQARKWNALAEEFDLRVIGTLASQGEPANDVASQPAGELAMAGEPTFDLIPNFTGMLGFYPRLPWRIGRELREFRPDVAVAQSPYEAAAVVAARRLVGARTTLLLEVHGDWGTATRLYGSSARRLLEPISRRTARWALRHSDAVRTVSPFTSGLVRALGVEPAATFTTYFDVSAFVEKAPAPLPAEPRVLFVGVLERYKNVAGLAAAWRDVTPRVADARLHVVGRGRDRAVVEQLVADPQGRVEWTESLTAPGVAAALDATSVLVLPSFSEGLPRVVMEAFCRGRPVVASRAGGIPDIVEHGVNGLLVPPGDTHALADALVRVLGDRVLLERLAAGAAASAETWFQTPEQFAQRFRALVEQMLA